MHFIHSAAGRVVIASVSIVAGIGIGTMIFSEGPKSPAEQAAAFASGDGKRSGWKDDAPVASTGAGENSEKESQGFDRQALLAEGEELASRWPQSAEEAKRRAFELAATDPIAGLTLLSPLHARSLEGVTTWQRKIMGEWARRDQGQMQARLEKFFQPGAWIPEREHWMSITASLMQRENRAGLDSMLAWLGNATGSETEGLAIMAMDKVLTHYDSQSFGSVGNFLLQRTQDPIYREYLVRTSNLQAQKKPDEALTLIGRLPDAGLRVEALQAVVAGATHKDPAIVADWINSGRLFGSSGLASTLSPAEQADLRDKALRTYFEALITADPEYVAQYSSAIKDPEIRKHLQQMAHVVANTEMTGPDEYWQKNPLPEPK
jgi:hypothetical protein